MKEASVIIRFSNRSQARENNLNILLKHLEKHPSLEVILSVMEIDFTPPEWVIKTYSPEEFTSSRANNLGASIATTNKLIFQDADIIFQIGIYDEMIKVLNSFESVRVGETCVQLGQNNLRILQNNPATILNTVFKNCFRDAPGACIGLTKESFIRIGGHCELFKVYGWEDTYFRVKVKRLTTQTCLNRQMLHMPHEENYQIGQQPVNAHLYHELLETDGGDCVKLATRDREALLKNHPSFGLNP